MLLFASAVCGPLLVIDKSAWFTMLMVAELPPNERLAEPGAKGVGITETLAEKVAPAAREFTRMVTVFPLTLIRRCL